MTSLGWCLLLACAAVNTFGFGLAFSATLLNKRLDRRSDAGSRFFGGLVLILLGTVGGVAIVAYETNPRERASSVKSESTPAPSIWTRHETPDGRCSAEFPGAPREERQFREEGDTRPAIATLTFHHNEIVFALTSGDLPEELMFLLEADLHDLLSKDGRGEIVAEREIEMDGVRGREYDFRNGIRIRVATYDGRFVMMAACKLFSQRVDPDVSRFLDSFRFEKLKP